MVAMLLAVAASALASVWMTHDSISAPPTARQLLAHALLLHGVLGYESLSAGAWYVAIDFQLFAVFALVMCRVRRRTQVAGDRAGDGRHGCVALGLQSERVIGRLAPYFFGSYGLGALAWWASDRQRRTAEAALVAAAMVILGWVALDHTFRSRIAVALGTALVLVVVCRGNLSIPGLQSRLARYLGRISYAIFLVHFPVCLVVNAAFTRFAPHWPEVQMAGVLFAWMASIGAGAVFHRFVELPLAGLLIRCSGNRSRRNCQQRPNSVLKNWDRHRDTTVFVGFSYTPLGASPIFQRFLRRHRSSFTAIAADRIQRLRYLADRSCFRCSSNQSMASF